MTTPYPRDRAQKFLDRHGHVIMTALHIYSRDMRDHARQARDMYDSIKDDPHAHASQDRKFVTTEGLRMSSDMFAQSATQADAALTDLTHLRFPESDD